MTQHMNPNHYNCHSSEERALIHYLYKETNIIQNN